MIDNEFRGDYRTARRVLRRRLAEPAPGLIQLLTGPRQVGKTTLLLDIVKKHGQRAIYAALDGPEAALPGFWERLWARAESEATARRKAFLLLDEVHHLARWSARLKGEWDRLRRRRIPLHVVAAGFLGAPARNRLSREPGGPF